MSPSITPSPNQKYTPVGVCIYCGSTENPLSDEHVIPFGLGGNLILPKASCRRCATITGEVERFCLRPMLGNYRSTLRLPTRRPKERPATVKVTHWDAHGRQVTTDVPTDKYPGIALGYRLPPPGILIDGDPQAPIEGELIVKTHLPELDRHRAPGKRTVLKLGTFNTLKYMRMLAKIGHAHAVAKLGPNSFIPLLQDLILGRTDTARWLVGTDPNADDLPPDSSLHELWLEQVEVSTGTYMVAGVRLFAFAGMPKYHVVVGQMR
jgi:hypothetical protein